MIKISPSFLQSDAWKNLQNSIGKKTFELEIENSKILVIKTGIQFGLNYLYIPHGPDSNILHNENLKKLFLDSVIDLARKERSIFVRIDPRITENEELLKSLKDVGFIRTQEIQPKRTIIIDTAKNQEDILNRMESETRYAIRTAEKRGVKILILTSLEEKKKYFDKFWEIFVRRMERDSLVYYSREYFENLIGFDGDPRTDLYIAVTEDDNIISGAIFIKYKKDYIYLYAASVEGFGRYNAPSFVIWRAIEQAKKEGSEVFDFWGISYVKKKWEGITKFKKSFGGEEVAFLGAWDLPVKKIWYSIYLGYKKFL